MSKPSGHKFAGFILLCVLFSLISGCQEVPQGAGQVRRDAGSRAPLIIQAAASTQEALDEVLAQFRAETNIEAKPNYASSAALAQQILQGAPADLFLSASAEWVDKLAENQLVAARLDLLGNRLVLIVPQDSTISLADMEGLMQDDVEHLALADPDSVPAGKYARQVLEKLQLWERISERVVRGADVRQALTFVEQGEADAGIVYATDAALSKKVKVVMEIDAGLSETIVYPLARLHSSQNPERAQQLFEYLASDESAEIFRKYGFKLLSTTDAKQQ